MIAVSPGIDRRDQVLPDEVPPPPPPTPTAGEFHAHDNLFFSRTEDGGVKVRVGDLFETVLNPASWASVMASVSFRGEDGQTWREALAFHTEARR